MRSLSRLLKMVFGVPYLATAIFENKQMKIDKQVNRERNLVESRPVR